MSATAAVRNNPNQAALMRKLSFAAHTLNLPSLQLLMAAMLWLCAPVSGSSADIPKPVYECGISNINKIAGELHTALESKKQHAVQPAIILLEIVQTPCVSPVEISKDGQVQRAVQLSTGFIRFINAVSHAKALSESGNERVKAYAARIAPSTPTPSVTDGLPPEKAWSFDVMNIQAGEFNQMAGALVAIDYAHHYLGHYKKYASHLVAGADGTVAPIGQFLTEREWREAVLKGAKNALDCGLGVDGLKTLFACMEAMPARPAWCEYIAPAKANLSKVSKDLQRLENDFFLVEK